MRLLSISFPSRVFNPVINAGPYELNISTYQFKKNSKTIDLSTIEFELLKLLITHPGEVIPRQRILSEIWGDDVYVDSRTVDAHVAKLRRKMGDKEKQAWIRCMRGVGYKFVEY